MVEAMEMQKGFKQTEIGAIPSDWEITEFKSIVSKLIDNRGKTPPYSKKEAIELIETSSISLVNQHPDYSKVTKYVSKYTFENWFRDHPRKDDILVSTVGEYSGSTALISETRGTIAQNLIAVRVKNVVSAYIFQWSRSSCYKKQLDQVMMSHAQPSLRVPWLLNFQIPVPPTKTEQTAIATALNDADALITQLEKLIAKKRAIKQGAMQELLKPKEGWKVKKLRKVFKFLKTANNSRADLLQDGEFEYIHYGDIHTKWNSFLDCSKNILPFIPNEKIKSVPFLQEGDLIIADASEDYEGLGACIEIKSIGNRKIVAGLHTMLLRGDKEIILDGFKGYFRNFHGVKEALIASSTGVSVYGISKSKLKNIEIKIPTKETQTRIAQILSDMDAEIEALENKLNKYKMIKQGMMQNLLTGRIRLV